MTKGTKVSQNTHFLTHDNKEGCKRRREEEMTKEAHASLAYARFVKSL